MANGSSGNDAETTSPERNELTLQSFVNIVCVRNSFTSAQNNSGLVFRGFGRIMGDFVRRAVTVSPQLWSLTAWKWAARPFIIECKFAAPRWRRCNSESQRGYKGRRPNLATKTAFSHS